MEMFNNPYQANIVFAIKHDSKTDQIHVEDIYWACKGRCDKELEYYYTNELGLSTGWKDIGDLIITVLFLEWLMADLNNLREGRYIYSEKAFKKLKHFIIALSQKVFREMTEEEKRRAITMMQISHIFM